VHEAAERLLDRDVVSTQLLVDFFDEFDHRRAMQTLSHGVRLHERRRSNTPIRHGFVVLARGACPARR
jgi:hypothetical protein